MNTNLLHQACDTLASIFFASLVITLITAGVLVYYEMPVFVPMCALNTLLILITLAWRQVEALVLTSSKDEANEDERAAFYAKYQNERRIREVKQALTQNPWSLQSHLMTISDQRQPTAPALTNEGLMYAALIMEESAETYAAIAEVIANCLNENPNQPDTNRLLSIETALMGCARQCSLFSLTIRRHLEDFKLFIHLDPLDVIDILDGTTDIAVVNSGFALAMGLPGREAYLEVVNSNLSKADPVTEMILKTADGKWIKGPNYKQPDLLKVLKAAQV